jgi:hypothetical protein
MCLARALPLSQKLEEFNLVQAQDEAREAKPRFVGISLRSHPRDRAVDHLGALARFCVPLADWRKPAEERFVKPQRVICSLKKKLVPFNRRNR